MARSVLSRLKRAARQVMSAPAQQRGREPVHFLHIGKNAGSNVGAIMTRLEKSGSGISFRKHGHNIRLKDIPEGAPYFFSVRSPVSRFRSGFYSRKRKGQPLYNVEWSACETEAFNRFAHANDLAEALFEPGEAGLAATAAILSISHTSMNQVSWFERWGHALTVRPPVWIIRQEQFDADMASFLDRLGVPSAPVETRDAKRSHANDYGDVPALSPKAIENLKRWYCQDLAFYALCEDWIERQHHLTAAAAAV
jgi:hypothetical protein